MAKIFRLNDCDWVASNTMEEVIEWYLNETGLPEDEALYEQHEVENPDKMMVIMEKLEGDMEDKYKMLQEKYLKDDELTYKVPADELLEIEWEGEPFIFCSTEY